MPLGFLQELQKPVTSPAGKVFLSDLLKFSGVIQDGINEFQQGRFEQQVAESNAQSFLAQASAERDRVNRRNLRRQGALRANLARGGLSGSALDILADQAAEDELDEALVSFGGDVRARSSRAQGTAARSRGDSSLLGSLIDGGADLFEASDRFRSSTGSGPDSLGVIE